MDSVFYIKFGLFILFLGILQPVFVNAENYDAVVNLDASTTWYGCEKGTSQSVAFSVVLTDGTKTTKDTGYTEPNNLYKSEAPGFIVVLANNISMQNYIDPLLQMSDYYPSLSCWSYKPVVPVTNCTKSGKVAGGLQNLCIAVTNPSSNQLQFQLNIAFYDPSNPPSITGSSSNPSKTNSGSSTDSADGTTGSGSNPSKTNSGSAIAQILKNSADILALNLSPIILLMTFSTLMLKISNKSKLSVQMNRKFGIKIFRIFVFLWTLTITHSTPIIRRNDVDTSDLLSDTGDHFMVDLGALDGSKFFPSTAELTSDDNEPDATVTDTSTTTGTPQKNKLRRPHIRSSTYVPGLGYISEKKLEELPKGTTQTSQTSEYSGDDTQANSLSLEDQKNIKDFEHTSGSHIPPGLKKQKVQLINPQTQEHEHTVITE
ncbi:10783_t:CDS:2 [Ambispora leptoticha]|uniref:10783_t:CDS:1 n=1 Tax=Ambispora leptoticha TaxID=144679 RepID=A0A9N9FNB0_9GLOM|nr:10783_t:CDS:2 [Ambispora leptoticha]